MEQIVGFHEPKFLKKFFDQQKKPRYRWLSRPMTFGPGWYLIDPVNNYRREDGGVWPLLMP